ncbi:MAG: hypothetical protein JNM27_19785 [Leptospirales bacterium]|nr:hypothetical protein [Leptospirales bacterium]
MILEDTLKLLLGGIGRSEEYEFYLNRFRAFDSPCFCFLIPDLETIGSARASILANLEFLMKLELYPGILFSGVAASHSLTRDFISQANDIIRPIQLETNQVQSTATKLAAESRAAHRIPAFLTPELLLDRSILSLSSIAQRFHLLRLAGPIHNGKIPVPYADSQSLPQGVAMEDRALTQMAEAVVGEAGGLERLHISLCTPHQLLHEIFTVKGSGTIFRPMSSILHLKSRNDMDEARLIHLLETSFRKKLRSKNFLSDVTDVYLESNYKGAVLFEAVPCGNYLSKFAVSTQARGDGVAQDLWDALSRSQSSFFWRARRGNSIEKWYTRLADGFQRSGKWMIFWKNVEASRVPDVIRYCESRAEDFDDVV